MTGRQVRSRVDMITKMSGTKSSSSADSGARRILVLGSPGSGKSTLAQRLALALNLPHIKVDDLYWQAGWTRPPEAEFIARLDEAVCERAWIIDGNYHRHLAARLTRAEVVVFLDVAPWLCALRVLLRGWRRACGERASLPKKVTTQGKYRHPLAPDFAFWNLIFCFRRRIRPCMLAEIAAYPEVRLITLQTAGEIADFVDGT